MRPTLQADAEIPLSNLSPTLLEYLDWMQPTGYGNQPASFVSRRIKPVRYRTVGKDNSHLKLSVSDGHITFEAIAFRQGHWANQMPQYVDLLYRFEMNEFNGRQTLQLNIQDIKATS